MPAKMTFHDKFVFAIALLPALLPSGLSATNAVPYDIVYVRQPRFGDNTNTTWPEVFHPARLDPGADLMLLRPDGTEDLLVAGGNGSVTDPFISFDAKWCYYVLFPDLRNAISNPAMRLSDDIREDIGVE